MYPLRRAKYNNKKTVIDGITFDSKKEASRYMDLKFLEKTGSITDLELQKKFQIVPPQKGEKVRFYIADFVYKQGGRNIIEDVKSAITRKNSTYTLKRALVKHLYPQFTFIES